MTYKITWKDRLKAAKWPLILVTALIFGGVAKLTSEAYPVIGKIIYTSGLVGALGGFLYICFILYQHKIEQIKKEKMNDSDPHSNGWSV